MAVLGVAALPALAQPAAPSTAEQPSTALEPVVVSGSGIERRAFETPYAVTVVGAEELRSAGPMVNLSEALARVPGLTVNSRNNYAQDLQISSRGFGARSTFGVRGMRLYTDGIPATMPDGQGQVTHFDLAGAQRVEVLRGPFSALYGNSSGGVISLVSAPPRQRAGEIALDIGSFGLRQLRVGAEAPIGHGFDIRAQASQFEIDGFRPQSEARRRLLNMRLGWRGELDTVTVHINSVNQPAQDPLGLTRARFDADPYQTTPEAIQFNTRKTARQDQVGLQWRRRLVTGGALNESVVTTYAGQRSVTQWQAIPVATQTPATHPGGVVDFDRLYYGVDGRLVWRWERAQLIAGAAVEQQDEDRRGFENFIGTGPTQQLGVIGRLRRNEANRARSTDAYTQGEVEFGAGLSGTLGVRTGRLNVTTRDAYIVPGTANGDDSGSLKYTYTNPVAALQWKPTNSLNVYVSAGRGFESPTLTELAYRADGQSGFNTALRPQRSRQLEVGVKWRDQARRLAGDVAVFRADTTDEISVLTNAGGRSTFQNVGATRRQGVEASGRWQISPAWRTLVALTFLDATYRDSFLTCAGVPCTAPTVPVPDGNRIAGTADKSGFAELAWRPWRDVTEFAAEARAQGSIPVNDVNSDFAKGAVILALRATHEIPLPLGRLEMLARVDNVSNRRYAGSVIVNDGNGRYFEPGAPRNWLLGARWRTTF
jgi:iron complex outermembrane receptor protein